MRYERSSLRAGNLLLAGTLLQAKKVQASKAWRHAPGPLGTEGPVSASTGLESASLDSDRTDILTAITAGNPGMLTFSPVYRRDSYQLSPDQPNIALLPSF